MKVFAYQYGDKPRYKYLISIPEETIEQLGWQAGSELNAVPKDNKIIIEFISKPLKKSRKNPEPKMTYEEFKNKISILLTNHDGLTWTEIRNKLDLPQVVPNNKWVRQMENDIGLLRLRDPKGIVWKVKNV